MCLIVTTATKLVWYVGVLNICLQLRLKIRTDEDHLKLASCTCNVMLLRCSNPAIQTADIPLAVKAKTCSRPKLVEYHCLPDPSLKLLMEKQLTAKSRVKSDY